MKLASPSSINRSPLFTHSVFPSVCIGTVESKKLFRVWVTCALYQFYKESLIAHLVAYSLHTLLTYVTFGRASVLSQMNEQSGSIPYGVHVNVVCVVS